MNLLVRQNEGDIDWSIFNGPLEDPKTGISVTISCGGFTEFLCRHILLDCKSANCPYALVSDGGTCGLVKYKKVKHSPKYEKNDEFSESRK